MKAAVIIGSLIAVGITFMTWCCIRINHKED